MLLLSLKALSITLFLHLSHVIFENDMRCRGLTITILLSGSIFANLYFLPHKHSLPEIVICVMPLSSIQKYCSFSKLVVPIKCPFICISQLHPCPYYTLLSSLIQKRKLHNSDHAYCYYCKCKYYQSYCNFRHYWNFSLLTHLYSRFPDSIWQTV